jgi:hypothetical protein
MTPTSRGARRITWLAGLILIFALLGHDALMASVSRAAQHNPSATAARTSHASSVQHVPEHPEHCDTTREAIPNTGNSLGVDDAGCAPTAIHTDLSALTPALARSWSEPFWPPGMRRALFQVYRI